MSTTPLIHLDAAQVRQARSLAKRAGAPVVKIAKNHTTVSVERATLRLAGLTGADHEGQPWVNHLVDAVRGQVGLEHGVTTPVYDALRRAVMIDGMSRRCAATYFGINRKTVDKMLIFPEPPQHGRSGRTYSRKPVSYTHLRAHETVLDIVCRLLLEKKTHIQIEKPCLINQATDNEEKRRSTLQTIDQSAMNK